MNRQSSSNFMTRLCRGVSLLALLSLASPVIPHAQGKQKGDAPSCDPGSWTEAAPVAIDHFGGFMDSDGTYGYEGGGYAFSTGDNILQFGRFDPVANTWTPLAPVPDPNNALASAVYAPNVNKLFVFGGEEIAFATVVNTTRIYDIATNKWSTGAPMPDIRAFMGAGYWNGKIYLVGGYNSGNVDPAFSQVWEYDTVANTWNTNKASMPVALGGPGSGVINGHLYIAGGRDINNTNYNTLYDYDIAANTWTTRASLPEGTNVPSSAVIGGQLWVVGGGNPFLGSASLPTGKSIFGPDTSNSLQIYDPASNSWTTGPGMNEFRSFAAGCAVGDTAVAVGGYDGFGSVTSAEINKADCGGGSITLTADVIRQSGKRFVALTWSPANGGGMNVFRNGDLIASTSDDGFTKSQLGNHTGEFSYQVCETDTGTCSNEVTVRVH